MGTPAKKGHEAGQHRQRRERGLGDLREGDPTRPRQERRIRCVSWGNPGPPRASSPGPRSAVAPIPTTGPLLSLPAHLVSAQKVPVNDTCPRGEQRTEQNRPRCHGEKGHLQKLSPPPAQGSPLAQPAAWGPPGWGMWGQQGWQLRLSPNRSGSRIGQRRVVAACATHGLRQVEPDANGCRHGRPRAHGRTGRAEPRVQPRDGDVTATASERKSSLDPRTT